MKTLCHALALQSPVLIPADPAFIPWTWPLATGRYVLRLLQGLLRRRDLCFPDGSPNAVASNGELNFHFNPGISNTQGSIFRRALGSWAHRLPSHKENLELRPPLSSSLEQFYLRSWVPTACFVSRAAQAYSLVEREMCIIYVSTCIRLTTENKEMWVRKMSKIKEYLYISWAVKLEHNTSNFITSIHQIYTLGILFFSHLKLDIEV